MQLLLFLSALLAGLTGAISGDRAGAVRMEQGTAITRAAEHVAEAAIAARHVATSFPHHDVRFAAAPAFFLAPAPVLRDARLTSERRLE